MNVCNECSIKEICSIYNEIKKYLHIATINVDNCSHRSYIGNKYKEHNSNINATPIIEDKHINKRTDKITELSNKNSNKKLQQKTKDLSKNKAKPKLIAKPLELNTTCPTCNGKTFEGDIGTCMECGTTICSCCATIDSNTKKILCSKCWDKL